MTDYRLDYRLIAAELDQITTRYNQLDEHLYPLLKEFSKWMDTEFPTPGIGAERWAYTNWAWKLYPHVGNDYASIDTDAPYAENGIRFEGHDRDNDTFQVILPFLWLEDREAFRAHVIEGVAKLAADAEREKSDQAATARQAQIDAARKLLAEVDGA